MSKFILSVDHQSFIDDLGLNKDSLGVEEVLVTPDLNATYESITEEGNEENVKQEQSESFINSAVIDEDSNCDNLMIDVKEELHAAQCGDQTENRQENFKHPPSSVEVGDKEDRVDFSNLLRESGGTGDFVSSIDNSLSSLLDQIKNEEEISSAAQEVKPLPVSNPPVLKVRSLEHLVDKNLAQQPHTPISKDVKGEPSKRIAISEPMIATPIPPGTRLVASNIQHKTTAETPLPAGVYKIKKGSQEYVLVVKRAQNNTVVSSETVQAAVNNQGSATHNVLEGSLTSTGWKFNDSNEAQNQHGLSSIINLTQAGQAIASVSDANTVSSSGSNVATQSGKYVGRINNIARLPITSQQTDEKGRRIIRIKAGALQPIQQKLVQGSGQAVLKAVSAPVPSTPTTTGVATVKPCSMGVTQGTEFTPSAAYKPNTGMAANEGDNAVDISKKDAASPMQSIGTFVLPKSCIPVGWRRHAVRTLNKETGKAAISSILRPDKNVVLSNREELENYVKSHNLPPIDPAVFDFRLNTEAGTPAVKSSARQIVNNVQDIADEQRDCQNAHNQLNPELPKGTTAVSFTNDKNTGSSAPSFQKLELRKMKVGNKVVLAPTIPGSKAVLSPTNPGSKVVLAPTIPGSKVVLAPTIPGNKVMVAPTIPGSKVVLAPTIPGKKVVLAASIHDSRMIVASTAAAAAVNTAPLTTTIATSHNVNDRSPQMPDSSRTAAELQGIQHSNVIEHDSSHVNGEATEDKDDVKEIDLDDQNSNQEGGAQHVESDRAAESQGSIPTTVAAAEHRDVKEIDLDDWNSNSEGEAELVEPVTVAESLESNSAATAGPVPNDEELSDDCSDLVIDEAEVVEENQPEVVHDESDPIGDERPDSVDHNFDLNDADAKGEVTEAHENTKDVVDDKEFTEMEQDRDDSLPSPDQNPCNLNLTCEEHLEDEN
eukprot:TRINITY_DN885_c0_g1_i2.p1 TRINITY_DN885_c0_g1~~TRINITY_DN885_c0_g1_i2.p1  ORF type:complete len:1091 (+),score=296.54 TRINITY_DN885_c0_g1_i2:457-3273(+)